MDDSKKTSTNKRQPNRPPLKPVTKHFQLELTKAFKIYMQQLGVDPNTSNLFKRQHCFGLVVCFSTFYLEKKHQWWTSLLQAIIKSQSHFTKPGYLDEMAHDWHLPQQAQIQTHRQLIDRAINYVIFSHADPITLPNTLRSPDLQTLPEVYSLPSKSDPYIAPYHFDQHIYLSDPNTLKERESNDKKPFQHEYLSQTGELTKIQSSETVWANFSKDLLSKTIECGDLENSISLLNYGHHVCALVYDSQRKQFGFYDPFEEQAEAFWFENKENFIDKIFDSSSSLSLKLTHSSPQAGRVFFQNFNALLDEPESFNALYPIKALPIIICHTDTLAQRVISIHRKRNKNIFSAILKEILEQFAIATPKSNKYIQYCIQHLLFNHKISGLALHQLLQQLGDKLSDGNTLLFHLADRAPKSLCYMFDHQVAPNTRSTFCFFCHPQKAPSKPLEDSRILQKNLEQHPHIVSWSHYWKPAALVLSLFLLLVVQTMSFSTSVITDEPYRPVPG